MILVVSTDVNHTFFGVWIHRNSWNSFPLATCGLQDEAWVLDWFYPSIASPADLVNTVRGYQQTVFELFESYTICIYIYIWQSTIRNDITLKKSRPCYLFALNTMARCCCFFDLVFQPPRRISTMGLGCRSSKLPSCFAQQIYQWDQAGPGLSNRAGLLAGFPNDNKHVCFLGQFGIFIYKIPYDKVNPLGI